MCLIAIRQTIKLVLILYCAAGGSSLDARAIAELTASEAVNLLCSRKISAVQYAEALLTRAEKYSCVNGFAFMDVEKVNYGDLLIT